MQKQGDIENTAQNILEARLQYPDESFAELYDPDKMPDDLLSAHKANDAAVEEVYGVDFNGRVPKSGVSKHFRCLKEVRLFPKI